MIRKVLTAIFIFAFFSGCAPQAPAAILATSTPTAPVFIPATDIVPTATPTEAPITKDGEEEECDHPFYPVRDGASWLYSLSSGGSAAHTLAVDENGAFIIQVAGDQSTFTIDGKCTEDGIVIMNAPGASTTYSGEEGGSVVQTIDMNGVTLPKELQVGKTWSQTINVTTGDSTSTIQADYTAVGFENLTVPAGNFYALKVEQSGYVKILGQTVDMHGFLWYAEGVGTVRSAMDGAPTVELVSYDIPE